MTQSITVVDDDDHIRVLPVEILADPCVVSYIWQPGQVDPSAWPGAQRLGTNSIAWEAGSRIIARMPDPATATLARLQIHNLTALDWQDWYEPPNSRYDASDPASVLKYLHAILQKTIPEPPDQTP